MNNVRMTINRLCLAWNEATNPAAYRTDAGHKATNKAARKIMTMIRRHGEFSRVHEFSNGFLYAKFD